MHESSAKICTILANSGLLKPTKLCLCDPGILEPKCLHQKQGKTNRQEMSCPYRNFHTCAEAQVGEKTSVKQEQTYSNICCVQHGSTVAHASFGL